MAAEQLDAAHAFEFLHLVDDDFMTGAHLVGYLLLSDREHGCIAPVW